MILGDLPGNRQLVALVTLLVLAKVYSQVYPPYLLLSCCICPESKRV